MSLLIKSATVNDPHSSHNGKKVDIFIENGIIISIGKNLKVKTDKVVESKTLQVSPGWVSLFADFCDPGYEHKETIESGMNAALAGGFTDIIITPDTHPVISSKSVLEYVQQKSKSHSARLHALGSISKNKEGKELSEMIDMHKQGAVAFSDGWTPVENTGLMLKALEYVKSFDGIVVQIPVETTLSKGGLMHEGKMSVSLGMSGVMPMAEAMMIHRDLELLRYTNSRLHITGVSSAAGIKLIRNAKKEGLQVTCSVTPYHLLYTDQQLKDYSSVYKTVPVLREESDRKALLKALEDGTVDCIATHHRPQDWDAKEKEFEYAEPGMITQETCWSMLQQAAPNITIDKWVALLSTNAREIFSLNTSGIEKGQKANITVFDTTGKWVYTTENKKSKGVNSPLLDKELTGCVYNIYQ